MNENPMFLSQPAECCGSRVVVVTKKGWTCPCGHVHKIDGKPAPKELVRKALTMSSEGRPYRYRD